MDQPVDASKTAAARQFLLEEYKAITQSLELNEQRGETRVNWFIGMTTASVGGLGALAGAEHHLAFPLLQQIAAGVFAALFAFGTVTLFRMITRNEGTDQLKAALKDLRKIVADDAGPMLANWKPFKGGQRRQLGGLTHLVAMLNSIVLAGFVAVLFIDGNEIDVRFTSPAAPMGLCTLVDMFLGQWTVIYIRESAGKKKKL